MSTTKTDRIPRGYTVEEVAELRKDKILAEYDFIRQKEQEIQNKEREISSIREVVSKKKIEYRIESVQRVLEFIRHADITNKRDLDLLLCHCQNKLNGNIDGTEIDLGHFIAKEEKKNDSK